MSFANIGFVFVIILRPLRMYLIRGDEAHSTMWCTCSKLQGTAMTATRLTNNHGDTQSVLSSPRGPRKTSETKEGKTEREKKRNWERKKETQNCLCPAYILISIGSTIIC